MKKALITGITGQDGSFLAEFLVEKGYEVHKCPKFISDEEAKRRGKGRPMLQVDKDSLIREILPDEMIRYWMRDGM